MTTTMPQSSVAEPIELGIVVSHHQESPSPDPVNMQ